jgi:hypothetical protein
MDPWNVIKMYVYVCNTMMYLVDLVNTNLHDRNMFYKTLNRTIIVKCNLHVFLLIYFEMYHTHSETLELYLNHKDMTKDNYLSKES